ncbi:GldG family protein [Defluviitalea phaphyphila]|uniref:GldG family protein n=1 Tax=Defluviitalea phaphyphila TaxID=1473580 RepID=UPI000731D62C|nr:GldG family protein [Defluviitalea phaphyphila]
MNKNKLKKNIKYGTNSIIFTSAVIGVVILINLMLSSLPFKLDLTHGKLYTLSDEGKDALKHIDEEIEILFFADPSDNISLDIQELYKNMKEINNKISLEIINPMKNPSLVNEYQINSMYTSVVSSSKRSIQVPSYDLIRINYETGEQYFDGEAALIQAILDVSDEDQNKIYIIEGHGEFQKDVELSLLSSFLEQKGVLVDTYSLPSQNEIPEDADIIYILGPQFDYTKEEINTIKNYLDNGGKVFLAFDSFGENNLPNLKELSSSYGINVKDNILTDDKSNYSGDEQTLIPLYSSHSIVERLNEDNIATIIPRALELSIEEKEGITNEVVLKTSDDLPIAVTAEKDLDNNKKMQLLVIGNVFFAHNEVISLAGNSEIFLGSLKWFDNDAYILNIPPKTYTPEPIVLVGNQGILIFIVSVILIPLSVFLLGGLIYFRRRTL